MYATALAIMLLTGPPGSAKPPPGPPPATAVGKSEAKPPGPSEVDARRKLARAKARARNKRTLAAMDAEAGAALASLGSANFGPPPVQAASTGGGPSMDPTMFSLPHQYQALFQRAQATVTAANAAMT